MNAKLFELRDKGTFIPIIAISLNTLDTITERERYLLNRAGFIACNNILLTRINGDKACYDPYDWGDRTFHVAHNYITDNFNELVSGQVIDVEYILGETAQPKESEQYTT